jgi:hypothetical protein
MGVVVVVRTVALVRSTRLDTTVVVVVVLYTAAAAAVAVIQGYNWGASSGWFRILRVATLILWFGGSCIAATTTCGTLGGRRNGSGTNFAARNGKGIGNGNQLLLLLSIHGGQGTQRASSWSMMMMMMRIRL